MGQTPGNGLQMTFHLENQGQCHQQYVSECSSSSRCFVMNQDEFFAYIAEMAILVSKCPQIAWKLILTLKFKVSIIYCQCSFSAFSCRCFVKTRRDFFRWNFVDLGVKMPYITFNDRVDLENQGQYHRMSVYLCKEVLRQDPGRLFHRHCSNCGDLVVNMAENDRWPWKSRSLSPPTVYVLGQGQVRLFIMIQDDFFHRHCRHYSCSIRIIRWREIRVF